MSDIAVRTEGLGKAYALGVSRRGYGTLRESVAEASQRSLRRLARRRIPSRQVDLVWALRDLSLTVNRGEVVGLIGHNGAGKSTLLKILARITEPSRGWAEVTGRVGSLLEVGTGFHLELTGRENIFLNGAILGMRRAEIRERFDEIVAFSDVERFLDTPVKRYSSGMQVRLAFSVAAHLETEILLVDEVLAVGDASFQRKSLRKMTEVASTGRTVFFVSHNLATIRALCDRAVFLERGGVEADGPVTTVIDRYLQTLEREDEEDLLKRPDRDMRGVQQTLIERLVIHDSSGHPGVVVGGRNVTVAVHVTEVLPDMHCRLTIVNGLGQPVATLDSEIFAPADSLKEDLGSRIECEIEALPLGPGRYSIDVRLAGQQQLQDGLRGAAFFDVEPGVFDQRPIPPAESYEGDVVLRHAWRLPA
jgi:lipopolysaccharide transport system ATP-binding protein